MKAFEYKIKNTAGLHARPAGALARMAEGFESEITIERGKDSAKLSKLLAVMQMGILCGETVRVSVSGFDEDKAYECIKVFFEDKL